jgi:flagellar biosynthetic protein FlhB
MADNSQRTEKATPQRLKKAREKGDFPAARDFVSALQFFAYVMLAGVSFPSWLEQLQAAARGGFRQAFAATLTSGDLISIMRRLASATLLPLGILGGVLMALTLLFQMGATNMGFSLARLIPNFDRLNPITRIGQLPFQNIGLLLQALVAVPAILCLTWALVQDRIADVYRLPLLPVVSGASTAGSLILNTLKESSLALTALGAIMLIRERARYSKRLRMSRQEIRDEAKENEGNPQIKARVRRIQRDMRRKNMMREVPAATAIIVNPTHYAVALKYEQGSMVAPQVVAKGRNYLAARIRQLGIDNQVPVIENPPLAQGLYKAVEVGQEIPPHLYRAVAEILAYIFRIVNPARRPR